MNPYLALLDRNDDSDEHLAELACGMAVPHSPRRGPRPAKWWNAIAALDDHRRERRQLQAQLANERTTP